MQRRLAGGGIEGSPQGLAVDDLHAGAGLAELVEEQSEAAGEACRVEQAEQAREGVRARQPCRQVDELCEQSRTVTAEIGESAKSTQLSAPQIDAVRAMVRNASRL